jgi:hypothetical protein
MTKQESNCCNADMIVEGNTTKYYVCVACKKPCDPAEVTIKQKIEKKFDNKYNYEINKV